MPRVANQSRQALLLYAALAGAPHRWRHGYDLMRETGIKSGTLYPLLIRLRDSGLLESAWQHDEAGPPRHAYRLTDEGLAFAQTLVPTIAARGRGLAAA